MVKKRSVLVFVNIIAPYNIPFFNKINDLLAGEALFVFDQARELNRSWKIAQDEIRFSYQIVNSPSIKGTSRVGNNAVLQRTIYFPFFIFKYIWVYKPNTVLSIEFGLRTLFSIIMCKITGARLLIVSDVTSTTEANIGKVKKSFRRFMAQQADGSIARSYNAKDYLQSLGIPASRIAVSPYAIEQINNAATQSVAYQQAMSLIQAKRKNRFCFVYSGHFIHLKGLDILFRVVEGLPVSIKDRLLFIMAGGTKSDLLDIAPAYNEDIFLPVGTIPNNEMLFLYPEADCFILPTRSDTWALVVNEAVVAGCPVMVSRYAGSAGELIEDGKTGIVFDPMDENEFAAKIVYAVHNKEALTAMAVQAGKKLSEYNNDVAAVRAVEMIKKVGSG